MIVTAKWTAGQYLSRRLSFRVILASQKGESRPLVVYYSQLMAVAYGANATDAGLDGNIIRAIKLEEIAAK